MALSSVVPPSGNKKRTKLENLGLAMDILGSAISAGNTVSGMFGDSGSAGMTQGGGFAFKMPWDDANRRWMNYLESIKPKG